MTFQYCTKCGTLLDKKIIGDEGELPYCSVCQTPYFDYIGLCTISCVMNEKDEVVLVRDKRSDRFGLIAGYVKKHENLEESAMREIKEESGIQVDGIQYAGSYYYEAKELMMAGFYARTESRDLELTNEIAEIKWIRIDDAVLELREGSIAQKIVRGIIETKKLQGKHY